LSCVLIPTYVSRFDLKVRNTITRFEHYNKKVDPKSKASQTMTEQHIIIDSEQTLEAMLAPVSRDRFYTTHVTIHRTRAIIAQSLGHLQHLPSLSPPSPQNHRIDRNALDKPSSSPMHCSTPSAQLITLDIILILQSH
jgi:hypothetical protein